MKDQVKKKLIPGNKVGDVYDIHAEIFDRLGYKKSRMNACGYSLGATFAPNWMDVPPMIFTGNPLIIKPGMVFFMHMILMDSEAQLAINLGETYLVTETGNERLGKQKLDLVVLQGLSSSLSPSLNKFYFLTYCHYYCMEF